MVAAGVLAYGVLELVEAVGLWLMKRWGEYVAVVGTVDVHPARGLRARGAVTWLRVVAFALNVFAVVYLLWTKRLFGIRGGRRRSRGAGEGLAARGRAGRAGRGARAAPPGSDRQPPQTQLGAQRPVGEQDAVEPGGPAPPSTLSALSSTNTQLSSGSPRAPASTSKIRRVGLGQRLGPGDHDVLEEPEEPEAVERHREQLVGPVGQREDADAGGVQVAEHLDGGADRPTRDRSKCVR